MNVWCSVHMRPFEMTGDKSFILSSERDSRPWSHDILATYFGNLDISAKTITQRHFFWLISSFFYITKIRLWSWQKKHIPIVIGQFLYAVLSCVDCVVLHANNVFKMWFCFSFTLKFQVDLKVSWSKRRSALHNWIILGYYGYCRPLDKKPKLNYQERAGWITCSRRRSFK